MSTQATYDSQQTMEQTLGRVKTYEAIIESAAKQYGVNPADIRAIISVESHGKMGQKAGDGGAAHGLMEITGGTWSEMQKRHAELKKYDFARDWDKPEVNILFGAATLAAKRDAVTKMGMPASLAVVAYNAGEGVVKYAYQHAKQAGVSNPEQTCMQTYAHVEYAVIQTGIYSYYMKTGKNRKALPKEEAIKRKTNEVLQYPNRVQRYLEEQQREGMTTGVATTPRTEPQKTESQKTESQKTDSKDSKDSNDGGGTVTVTTSDMKPIKPGHIISDSVGEGGNNHEGDVGTIQDKLASHGHSPGKIDHKMGPNTIKAIRAFQADFLDRPDGRVDVGGPSEKHLMDAASKKAKTTKSKTTETKQADAKTEKESETQAANSEGGGAQMQKVESIAAGVAAGHPPRDHLCYHHVKDYLRQAGGYGNIKDVQTDKRFAGFTGEAHMFADRVNSLGPDKFGLEKLAVSTPFEAPLGALVVVKHGTPGTKHPTAGDMTVRGPSDDFYNGGTMHYGGRKAWPLKTSAGGLLGVYRPK